MSKLVKCKACGKEIAKGTKCVGCGKDQRNFFGKHKIITGLLVVIVIAVISSATSGSKDKTATTSTTNVASKADTTKPVVKKVAVLNVTTQVLGKAYESNEVKADKLYKGKTIQTSGKITDISVVLGNTTLTLSTGADFDLGILCSFKEQADIDKIADLNKGDTVKVQGVVDGKSLGVTVSDCILK